MSVKDLKTRTKVFLASAGILGLAGVGLGAANAVTPAPAPVTTQSVTADELTPGDVADAPEAAEVPDPADGPEAPGDSGTNEQDGDSTDAVEAPGAP